jgi:hypothetical protein
LASRGDRGDFSRCQGATIGSLEELHYTVVLHLRWLVLPGVLALACGHDTEPLDHGRQFLGEWECNSGRREIDCGQEVAVANLALGPSKLIQFSEGTATSLVLRITSSMVVPGLPGGPSCDLALDANGENALLNAAATCIDEQGGSVVIHEASAQIGGTALLLNTAATNSRNCSVETEAICYDAR